LVASFLSRHAPSPSDPVIFPAIAGNPCSEVIREVGSPSSEKNPIGVAQSREEAPCEMGVPVATLLATGERERVADSRFSGIVSANRISDPARVMESSAAFRFWDAPEDSMVASASRTSDPARVMAKAEVSRFWDLNPGSVRLSEPCVEFRTWVTDLVLCHSHVLLPLAGFRFQEHVDPEQVSSRRWDFCQVAER